MNIAMALDAVALRLIGKDILVSRVRWFDREDTFGLDMALDTVLPNFGVGVYEFEIRFTMVKLTVIAEVLRVVAEIAASIVEFIMKLLFMRRCMAIDAEVFVGVRKLINLFAVFLVARFTCRLGVISGQRKSRHEVMIKPRQLAAFELPAVG